jgi:8-oxo-dGTP pyrophosphatase MutT (NUDIX family)
MNHRETINKKCRLSYGIICIKNNNQDFQLMDKLRNKSPLTTNEIANLDILMIRRKHSYNYTEFIMGKYDLNNPEYIILLLSEITELEKRILLDEDITFDELWRNLWNIIDDQEITNYQTEFNSAKNKFQRLLSGYSIFLNGQNIQIQMKSILQLPHKYLEEPEWGFPKGKRNIHESDINCSLREFTEETNIPASNIRILPMNPFQEYYKASNRKFYCNIYYIAEYITNSNDELTILDNNIHQRQEISDIRWISWTNSNEFIRSNYTYRKNILAQLEFIFKNIH